MKKLLYLFLVFGLFACSSDSDEDDSNPVYLDSNGITIKARDWAEIGMTGIINGTLYTIVDRDTLQTLMYGALLAFLQDCGFSLDLYIYL